TVLADVCALAVGGLVVAGDPIECGAPARPVRADKPQDFTLTHLEAEILDCHQPTKTGGHAIHIQKYLSIHDSSETCGLALAPCCEERFLKNRPTPIRPSVNNSTDKTMPTPYETFSKGPKPKPNSPSHVNAT